MVTQLQNELFSEIRRGSCFRTKALLEKNSIDLDFKIEGTTVLHEAALNMNLSIVDLLLHYGVSSHTLDIGDRTPIEAIEDAIEFDERGSEQYENIISLLENHIEHAAPSVLTGVVTVGGC